ncbi:endonuclease/exonuclease/phosphatase family protein [Actomonas aquatica]|uniref:Endonuclease/exonuclease/phosphatase family protein n=1 Tax=Actomonas aquatica TaxID=2866162 RepID=A0ABZ1CD75_9BACT|nr:endonuclease/exonuclease/phosphatase family protein [Opitutus sp. WL0086]WRQ89509.1 endonuclease/exonuclease/phosphatase family protein [Opitutus sp. WL0086]
MSLRPVLFRFVALVCTLIGVATATATAADAPLPLKVMTFNLRYASDQNPHAWPDRRPAVAAIIRQHAPDVLGTQEGLHRQVTDIDTDLPGYGWLGQGRAGGNDDEFCAIFYRLDRVQPIKSGHFWLSDTPEVVGSMTWGNRYRRMVTWARFRELRTEREFVVLNTHFDHEVEAARQKSAALIVERLPELAGDLPVVVVGDFNCTAGDSPAFSTLTDGTGLIDTWTAASWIEPDTGVNTFHGYEAPVFNNERIDWILARQPVQVGRSDIVMTRHEGEIPSDHFPVVVELTFPE